MDYTDPQCLTIAYGYTKFESTHQFCDLSESEFAVIQNSLSLQGLEIDNLGNIFLSATELHNENLRLTKEKIWQNVTDIQLDTLTKLLKNQEETAQSASRAQVTIFHPMCSV